MSYPATVVWPHIYIYISLSMISTVAVWTWGNNLETWIYLEYLDQIRSDWEWLALVDSIWQISWYWIYNYTNSCPQCLLIPELEPCCANYMGGLSAGLTNKICTNLHWLGSGVFNWCVSTTHAGSQGTPPSNTGVIKQGQCLPAWQPRGGPPCMAVLAAVQLFPMLGHGLI